ncbi:MAG: hypothetical protein D6828_06580 [Nitrospirae bacterium]|nr:MAG: hypothetical protein D6828_06580 [Nitrospirota bacterium]
MGASKSRRKRKKRSRKKNKGLNVLSQKLRSRLDKEGIVVVDSKGGVKMSEVLEAFVEPYIELADTEEKFRELVSIAVAAWNTSLLPKEVREEIIENVLVGFPEEIQKNAIQILEGFIRRKELYFSEYKRAIVDFEIAATKKGYNIVVVSMSVDEE